MNPWWWNAAFAVALLLWSDEIGEDPPLPPPAPVVETAPSPAPAPPRHGGGHARRPLLPVSASAGLDIRAFKAAFRRQAEDVLLPCLRLWQSPPGSLGLTAILDHTGRLAHVSPFDPSQALPACATSAIAAMDFKSLCGHLERPAVTLEWRIDW